MIVIVSLLFFAGYFSTYAQSVVEYKANEAIVDTDLDALTDQGEVQLFGTDPKDPDSDDDGFYDGVEVMHGTDPLNDQDPLMTLFGETVTDTTNERAPLAWYFSRATGIVSYVLLWLVIFFGLSFRNPLLKKFVAPIYKLDMHIYLSFLTLAFVVVHGAVLVLDKFIGLSVLDFFVPFLAQTDKVNVQAVAWGIISLYIMIIMTVTSLFRTKLPQKIWRWLHFLHVVVFVLVVMHVLVIGTDFQGGVTRVIFLVSVGILTFLYVVSLGEVIMRLTKAKRADTGQSS